MNPSTRRKITKGRIKVRFDQSRLLLSLSHGPLVDIMFLNQYLFSKFDILHPEHVPFPFNSFNNEKTGNKDFLLFVIIWKYRSKSRQSDIFVKT